MNVQVLPGATWVARFGDVLVWFETGPQGGGTVLPQLLQTAQAVSSLTLAPHQLGARLASVLNAADGSAVPALVAATPEADGLRVVVHGWGALVADGVHMPNGWVDEVIAHRRAFFLGRNTVTPVVPMVASTPDMRDGVVPGDGVSFEMGAATPAPFAAAPDPDLPRTGLVHPSPAPMVARPVTTTAPPLGRLVLDDGCVAVLERSCVLGSAPHASPAVQTGVALPLIVTGTGVAGLHAEVRVEVDRVTLRDLGGGATHLLAFGAEQWTLLAPGQVAPLEPGSSFALGQRTVSYART